MEESEREEVVLNAKLLMLRSYANMPKMARSKFEQFYVCLNLIKTSQDKGSQRSKACTQS